jgi:hypothetical protein
VTASNRSPSLQIDVQRIFWRLFWFFFLICQVAVWYHVRRLLPRGMGHRNFFMHMVVPSVLSSLFVSTLAATGLTLFAFLAVKVVVGPLLSSWLTPTIDPMAALFHLAPGEKCLDTIPARRRWRWTWQPGALVVTDRRIWFLPTAWAVEPWSVSRSEVIGYAADVPVFAEILPIRNWPGHVRLAIRDGRETTFAMADPRSLFSFFESGRSAVGPAFRSFDFGRGVFDV